MYYKKTALLLSISLLSSLTFLPAFAADIKNNDPLFFVKNSDWLTYNEVKKMLLPDAFWCFENENNSCSFYTIAKGEENNDLQQGQFFAYNVIELWDSDIILTTPTGGILRTDGNICEQYLDWIENISAQDLEKNSVSDEQLEEMKAELRGSWEVDRNTQYCFSYARTNPNQPEIITQFEYVNGEFSGYSLNFIMDYRADAIDSYQLRLD